MAAITPVGNVGSQLERAMAAYFVTQEIATADQIYISNDVKKRSFPTIDIFAHTSTEEVAHSRIEAYQVRVKCQLQSAVQQGETNPGLHWKDINVQVGRVMAAMSLVDDQNDFTRTAISITTAGRLLATTGTAQEQSNNSDMADFTCQYVQFMGSKRAEQNEQGIAFCEIRNFLIHAANANVD